MVSKQKATGRAYSIPVGLGYGIATSLGVTGLICALLGKLLDMEKISWEQVGYGIIVLLISASYLGAYVTYRKVKRQRLAICVLSGVLYMGSLLIITALFFGGQFEAIGVSAGLILAGCVTAGITGNPTKRGGNVRKRKKVYR